MQQILSRNADAALLRRSTRLVSLLLALFIAVSPRLLAQAATGTIAGRVTDTTGAISTAASVTLTRTDTGLVLHSVTNADGIYTFPSLQTGQYLVEIGHAGFKAAKASIKGRRRVEKQFNKPGTPSVRLRPR